MASAKVNVSLPPELLERMERYSKANNITRSGLVALSVSQYLNAVETMPDLQKLLGSMAAVFEGSIKGDLSEQEQKERMERIQESYTAISEKSSLK